MWEYKKVEINLNYRKAISTGKDAIPYQSEAQVLAELGEQGWELVSAVPAGVFGNITGTLLYFKRPKQTSP